MFHHQCLAHSTFFFSFERGSFN